MRYYELSSTDPCWNLAAEEYLFNHLSPGVSCLMLWQNDNAVIIGKNQIAQEEVNLDAVKKYGTKIVRRQSGGGAVYHDLGNLNFTFIVDKTDDTGIDFRNFCLPVAQAVQALGVPAEVSGRNDITIKGKKFSGNSQYTKNGRVMHHGTIMFNSNLEIVSQILQVDRSKFESKGIKSVSSRVTNIANYLETPISLTEFKSHLLRFLGAQISLQQKSFGAAEMEEITELSRGRYETWEWNFARVPKFKLECSRRFDSVGTVKARLEVAQGGIIAGLEFFGDFFGSKEPAELAAKLIGCPCQYEQILDRLSCFSVDEYFSNLSAEQLSELLAPSL